METKPIYEISWRNKWLTAQAQSLDAMIRFLTEAVDRLTAMQEAGVQFDGQSAGEDYVRLYTEDSEIARQFGMEVWEEAPGEELLFTAELEIVQDLEAQAHASGALERQANEADEAAWVKAAAERSVEGFVEYSVYEAFSGCETTWEDGRELVTDFFTRSVTREETTDMHRGDTALRVQVPVGTGPGHALLLLDEVIRKLKAECLMLQQLETPASTA
jgi:hypothetical protein